MKLDDVMTTQEAGERWYVPADSIKQCCLKRYANKQFTDDEARKSGKNWLVTRQGMERLYGKEEKTIQNLTNIKICLLRIEDIIHGVKSVEELVCNELLDNIYKQLHCYKIPEEIADISDLKLRIEKKDSFTNIEKIVKNCCNWITDELGGAHRTNY
jgi:hypothetical protein